MEQVIKPIMVAGAVLAVTLTLGIAVAQAGKPPRSSSTSAPSATARAKGVTVSRVIDGDTVEVNDSGTSRRIRLLNVDTPETVDPNQPVQCGGPEAAEWLRKRLPGGAIVQLEYDQERTDRFGRTLAKVVSQGQNVSAEIARAGLGLAMTISPNRRFYPEVAAAEQEARDAGRGLFAPGSSCTVEALVADQQTALAEAAATGTEPVTTVPDYDRRIATLALVLERARALKRDLDNPPDRFPWRGRQAQDLRRSAADLDRSRFRLEQVHQDLVRRRDQLATRTPSPRSTISPTVSPGPTPRETRDRRISTAPETSRATHPTIREPSRPAPRTLPPTTREPQRTQEPRPTAPVAEPTSKYTGPRCYAPGGKTWRPC